MDLRIEHEDICDKRKGNRIDLRIPCQRCKSDLKIRLMVACCSCRFRMHAYCMDPPMIQVPRPYFCENCKLDKLENLEIPVNKKQRLWKKGKAPTWQYKKLVAKKVDQKKLPIVKDSYVLNVPFEDEYHWKEFCARKLQLINSGQEDTLVEYRKRDVIQVKPKVKSKKRRNVLPVMERTGVIKKEQRQKTKAVKGSTQVALPTLQVDGPLAASMEVKDMKPSQAVETVSKVQQSGVEIRGEIELHGTIDGVVKPLKALGKRIEKVELTSKDGLDDKKQGHASKIELIEEKNGVAFDMEKFNARRLELEEQFKFEVQDGQVHWGEELLDIVQDAESINEEETEPLEIVIAESRTRRNAKITLGIITLDTELTAEEQHLENCDWMKRVILTLLEYSISQHQEQQRLALVRIEIEKLLKIQQNHSAKRLQRAIKSYAIRNKAAKKNRLRKNSAANKLISVCRRFLYKKHKRAAALAKVASITIQCCIRLYLAKLQVLKRRHMKKNQLAGKIIISFFTYFVRNAIGTKHVAANILQCAWKCSQARNVKKKLLRIKEQKQREEAATLIQSHIRGKLIRIRIRDGEKIGAAATIQYFLRVRFLRWKTKMEAKRMKFVRPILNLNLVNDSIEENVAVPDALYALGVYLFKNGKFILAASTIERARRHGHKLNAESSIILAVSHHKAWYTTCEKASLIYAQRAHAIAFTYKQNLLNPYNLIDFSTVKMQLGEFKASLEALIHVVTCFPTHECISKAIFLCALQLLYTGSYKDCLEYIRPIAENPPFGYGPIDTMLMTAFTYFKLGNKSVAKEGLKSALIRHKAEVEGATKSTSVADILTLFAQKAAVAGHYQLSVNINIFAIRRGGTQALISSWVQLALSLRHLGNLSKAKEAADSVLQLDPTNVTILRKNWGQAPIKFEKELEHTSDLEFLAKMAKEISNNLK